MTLAVSAANFDGVNATLDDAENHFAQLLLAVTAGEEVILHRGTVPVAKIVPISTAPVARPRVGEVTSAPVSWSAESFAPLTDAGLKELDLL